MMLLFLCLNLYAGATQHVDVSLKQAEGMVSVVVNAKKPFVINDTAPWNLEVLESKGVEISKNIFGKNDFVMKSELVSVKIGSVIKAELKLKVKITSFVCTENKSQCFRDIVEETLMVAQNPSRG